MLVRRNIGTVVIKKQSRNFNFTVLISLNVALISVTLIHINLMDNTQKKTMKQKWRIILIVI